jgi:hypothetical protein
VEQWFGLGGLEWIKEGDLNTLDNVCIKKGDMVGGAWNKKPPLTIEVFLCMLNFCQLKHVRCQVFEANQVSIDI